MRGRPAAALVALALAGCGTGATPAQYFDPQGPGATGRVGAVVVTNALLGAGGPGAALTVHATIVNEGTAPDRLVSLASPIAAGGEVVGDPALAPGQALTTAPAEPGAAADLPASAPVELRLTGPVSGVRAGLTYPVDFTFALAGTVRLALPVADPPGPRPADTG